MKTGNQFILNTVCPCGMINGIALTIGDTGADFLIIPRVKDVQIRIHNDKVYIHIGTCRTRKLWRNLEHKDLRIDAGYVDDVAEGDMPT